MITRNPIYNERSTIDCEIDHPKYGWIPFTASPDDVEQHGKDIYASLLAAGSIGAYVAPVLSPQEVATQYRRDREASLPSIGDQLDMIYWDNINSTTLWVDMISANKLAHPKP